SVGDRVAAHCTSEADGYRRRTAGNRRLPTPAKEETTPFRLERRLPRVLGEQGHAPIDVHLILGCADGADQVEAGYGVFPDGPVKDQVILPVAVRRRQEFGC